MINLRALEIDWDIHKLIEAERTSFEEPPYRALRRLLGLPDHSEPAGVLIPNAERSKLESPRAWFEDGVEIPHGSAARMRYNRNQQVYEGQFCDGLLIVDAQAFDSLSKAANELARTNAGTKTQLNGWKYWEVKRSGDKDWIRLEDLRDEARRELASKVQFNL